MNRSRKIMKKLTAAAAASALVLSGTSQVFAASYKETEKAALDKLVAGFPHIGMQLWHSMKRDRKQALTQR